MALAAGHSEGPVTRYRKQGSSGHRSTDNTSSVTRCWRAFGELHRVPLVVQFMPGLEGKDASLALLRKLDMCKSQAREQWAGLESKDKPDTAEGPG